MSWTEIMTSKSLFQNIFILRGPRVANFVDINQNENMFMFVLNYKLCIRMQSLSVFLDITKLLISSEKIPVSAELKGCVT